MFLGSMYFKKDLERFIIIIQELNGKAKERIAFPAQDAEETEKLYEDLYKELFKYLKKKY